MMAIQEFSLVVFIENEILVKVKLTGSLFSQSKLLDIGQSFFLNVNHDFFFFIKYITRAYKIYAAKKLDEEDIIDINLGRFTA